MSETNTLTPAARAVLTYWVGLHRRFYRAGQRHDGRRIASYSYDLEALFPGTQWWDMEAELTAAGYLTRSWGGEPHSMWEQRDHYLTDAALALIPAA